jgi:hypothetical protein
VARQSGGIVAISDDFRDLAVDWGVNPCRIAVVENWASILAGPPPTLAAIPRIIWRLARSEQLAPG